MGDKGDVVAYVGPAYRLTKIPVETGASWALETLSVGVWSQVQGWGDIGHVANMLVKHGAAADHTQALRLLQYSS